MKTQQLFLAMAAIGLMVFTACQNDSLTDRVAPDRSRIDLRGGQEFSLMSDIDLIVTSSPTSLSREAVNLNITGFGTGTSDVLGDAKLSLALQYNPSAHQLSGYVDMRFDKASSTVRLGLDGHESPIKYNNTEALVLNTTVLNATGEYASLEMDAVTYFFDAAPLLRLSGKEFSAHLLTEGSLDF